MTALTSQTNTLTDIVPTGSTDLTATEAVTVVAAPPPQEGPVETGAGLIIVLLLGFLLWRAIEKKRAKPVHVIMAFTMGVLLAGSMIGVMAQQTADSIGNGVQTMFSTVTTNSGR